MVTIANYPNYLTWSKNNAYYAFSVIGITPGWRLQVEFVDPNTGYIYGQVEYPITSYNDIIYVSKINELIDPTLYYAQPATTDPATSEHITAAGGQMGIFNIRYRVTPVGSTPAWTYHNWFIQMHKGGHGDLDIIQEALINQDLAYFRPQNKAFMTFVPSGRMMCPDEWAWMLYLSPEGATLSGPQQVIRYIGKYKDGSDFDFTRSIPLGGNPDYFGRSWFIPMGVEQAKLDPDNKGVVYYDIIAHQNAPFNLLDTYRINVDNRVYYNRKNLIYRNSFGGLDSISLRGFNEINGADAEKKETHQNRDFPNFDGENNFYESEMTFKFKANTGYISKKHKLALADLFNTTAAWILKGGKWMSMRVPGQKMEAVSSEDMLHSYTIEFETASAYKTLPLQLTTIDE